MATDYGEVVVLPRLADRLARLAPGIDLWVHAFADWGDDELATGALDAVIGPPRGTGRPAASYEKRLFAERFRCIVRAGHPLARGRLTLARYCAAAHLVVSPRGRPGTAVDTALAALGKQRRIALVVPHFPVVPHVVAASDLIATVPARIAALYGPALGLVTLPAPVAVPGSRSRWRGTSATTATRRTAGCASRSPRSPAEIR